MKYLVTALLLSVAAMGFSMTASALDFEHNFNGSVCQPYDKRHAHNLIASGNGVTNKHRRKPLWVTCPLDRQTFADADYTNMDVMVSFTNKYEGKEFACRLSARTASGGSPGAFSDDSFSWDESGPKLKRIMAYTNGTPSFTPIANYYDTFVLRCVIPPKATLHGISVYEYIDN